jgi:hypothetical protein
MNPSTSHHRLAGWVSSGIREWPAVRLQRDSQGSPDKRSLKCGTWRQKAGREIVGLIAIGRNSRNWYVRLNLRHDLVKSSLNI